MPTVLLLFTAVIRCFLSALQICLVIRAVISWFPEIADGSFGELIYVLTEPLVSFFRNIVLKIRPLREFPIDLSLLFACLFLGILLTFL